MLAIDNDRDLLAVDCGADIHQRMLLVGLEARPIAGLLLTHVHADHLAGFPLLVQKLWLSGVQDSLTVLGTTETVAAARRLLEVFAPDLWADRIKLNFVILDPTPEQVFEIGSSWSVQARWVDHIEPTLGFRFVDIPSGKVVAYSGDTAPCDSVVSLGDQADLLVHEATGDFEGHSSAAAAAEIARRSGARRLALVHAPGDGVDRKKDLDAARKIIPTAEYAVECGLYTI
jgi:ribonuclease Z